MAQGAQVRRVGGQVLQPGQDLGKKAVAGRQPQGQVAGMADQSAGTAISATAR
jgi:hypothetical protein